MESSDLLDGLSWSGDLSAIADALRIAFDGAGDILAFRNLRAIPAGERRGVVDFVKHSAASAIRTHTAGYVHGATIGVFLGSRQFLVESFVCVDTRIARLFLLVRRDLRELWI
jgi:hypothetical protein